MKSISVFFPAHNEEANIKKMVETTLAALDKTGLEYEVLVINDHSEDKTAQVVKKNFKDNPKVKLINNTGIKGYGSALKKGFASFSKDLVFFTDADLQFDMKEITKLLKYIEKYDYVIGYRMNRHDPIHRSFNAWAYAQLVKLLLGIHVRDIDCAFKVFKKDVIRSIPIYSNGALINAEILYKLKQKKYRFKEVGVHHYERKFGKSTGANLRVIARMFVELFKLKLNRLS